MSKEQTTSKPARQAQQAGPASQTVKKSAKQTVASKRHWLRYVLIAIPLLALVYALGYGMYQTNLDKQDAAKFATLKQDMQRLQTEFNKVDPGWVYGEGCTTGGEIYDRESNITCSLSLSNSKLPNTSYSIGSATERYSTTAIATGYFSSIERDSSYTYKDKKYSNKVLGREGIKYGICEISSNADYSSVSTNITCHIDARKLYFPRTDR